MGIEPTTLAWKAKVIPLNYTRSFWSEQQDLNLRPPVPKTGALPNCAMPRIQKILYTYNSKKSRTFSKARAPSGATSFFKHLLTQVKL